MSCEINFFDNIESGGGTGECPEWTTCLTNMFRVLINDVDPLNYEYSDARVCQLLNMAAFYVAGDLCDCPNLNFTIDLINSTVDPDPLTDPIIANLIVFKAVCLIDINATRNKAIFEGARAIAGPVSMSIGSNASALNSLLKNGACGMYQSLKDQCCFRKIVQTAEFCRAILDPFARGCYYPPVCGDSSRGNCRSC